MSPENLTGTFFIARLNLNKLHNPLKGNSAYRSQVVGQGFIKKNAKIRGKDTI